MTLLDEFLADLSVIVELSIDDSVDGAVFVEDGLLAALKIYEGEPLVSKQQ